MDSQARQIHTQAAQSRESGDLLKALQLADEAMLQYQKEGDQLLNNFERLYQAERTKNPGRAATVASWLIVAGNQT